MTTVLAPGPIWEETPQMLRPKVFIVNMFGLEAEAWQTGNAAKSLNLTARRIQVPGLSPKYPDIFCTEDGNVCQITTAEGLINASLALSALLSSPLFDLRNTYFILAGIAGVNPREGTLGTVAFATFAVQVDLQYEFDSREVPADWVTGYVPLGTTHPSQYPTQFYGTEIFSLNDELRKVAQSVAEKSTLRESQSAAAYGALYGTEPNDAYRAATLPPSVIQGDVATSDVFFHGPHITRGVDGYCRLLTKGQAKYCMAAQEDNGTLAALMRAAQAGRADFSRVILLRSGSNFDQPPPGKTISILDMPLHVAHGGIDIALENASIAGMEVVKKILGEWDGKFCAGIPPKKYVGDDPKMETAAPVS
ncbi:putative purine nucleoside permease [Schizothecium vesticola]|uniref:Purine nucleoside permease n=1 Tax=Schizothecium vesticola TaxID=314040 RepID=A0AA40EG82_9PEZI|nr:putative purine nucleoside permease [Schizothecium vesticola]